MSRLKEKTIQNKLDEIQMLVLDSEVSQEFLQMNVLFLFLNQIKNCLSKKTKEKREAKIKQYAAVEATHALRGPASDADAAARLAICMGCEHRAENYKGVADEEKIGWCEKCGCGNNPRAKLKVKVTLAGAECPEKKWGKVVGTGGSVASVAGAVAGVAASLAHAILPPKKSE